MLAKAAEITALLRSRIATFSVPLAYFLYRGVETVAPGILPAFPQTVHPWVAGAAVLMISIFFVDVTSEHINKRKEAKVAKDKKAAYISNVAQDIEDLNDQEFWILYACAFRNNRVFMACSGNPSIQELKQRRMINSNNFAMRDRAVSHSVNDAVFRAMRGKVGTVEFDPATSDRIFAYLITCD